MNYNKGYFTECMDLTEDNNDITTDTTYNNNNYEHNIIKINIFTKYGYCTNDEEMIVNGGMNSIKQIDENDINLTSFLSNINFFDHLTNICERIRFIDSPEMRQSELIKEITKINENLPYNVYIPFSNKEIRNNLICHISIKDTKVYKTKERAPIILTFECFRLEELCYEHNVKIKTQVVNEEIKTENNKNSLLSALDSKREIESQNKTLKYNMDKMNYLMSVDISLSKPIFVRKSHYINKSNKEEKDKKYEKINEITKRKKSDDSMQNNNILNQSINSETSENNNKQTDEESINNDNKQNKIVKINESNDSSALVKSKRNQAKRKNNNYKISLKDPKKLKRKNMEMIIAIK